jgi:hypothetical protein
MTMISPVSFNMATPQIAATVRSASAVRNFSALAPSSLAVVEQPIAGPTNYDLASGSLAQGFSVLAGINNMLSAMSNFAQAAMTSTSRANIAFQQRQFNTLLGKLGPAVLMAKGNGVSLGVRGSFGIAPAKWTSPGAIQSAFVSVGAALDGVQAAMANAQVSEGAVSSAAAAASITALLGEIDPSGAGANTGDELSELVTLREKESDSTAAMATYERSEEHAQSLIGL